MRAKHLALGAGVIALVAFSIWLGRSTAATADAGLVAHAVPPVTSQQVASSVSRGTARATPVLRATPSKPAIPGLAQDLADADPRIRREAVREAARDGDLDPVVMLAASRDRDLEVGIVATEALGKLHADGRIPAHELIARVTDRSVDERVRVSAINGLGLVASDEAGRFLAELVMRGETTERRSAAILLVHQEPELAVPALIAALGDADEVVRGNALESLRARSRGRDFGSDARAWRTWWQNRAR